MPNTAEGFYYPDASTNIAPLETVLANMAASSDTVSKQTPRVFANYAAMIAAIPAPTAGRLAVTTQGSGVLWQYDGAAAKWVVQNTPTFTDTAARDAAIPNPTAGVITVTGLGDTLAEHVWNGFAWLSVGGAGFATVEGVLTADFVPGSTFTDIGAPIGRGVPTAASVYEVTANIDLNQQEAASSILEVQLVAGSAVQTGELVAASIPGTAGLRYSATRTWRASGLTPGWTVFSVRAKATGAAVWRMHQTHSHVLVRQVA